MTRNTHFPFLWLCQSAPSKANPCTEQTLRLTRQRGGFLGISEIAHPRRDTWDSNKMPESCP